MTIDMTFEAREKIFRKEEYEEGLAEGKINTLISLVKNKAIDIATAAGYAGMPIEEFKKLLV